MANLSASYEFVKWLSNRSPLTSSSTLPAPPVSVNPIVKKEMFHHQGDEHMGMFNQANGVPPPSPGPPTNLWLGERPAREARKPV